MNAFSNGSQAAQAAQPEIKAGDWVRVVANDMNLSSIKVGDVAAVEGVSVNAECTTIYWIPTADNGHVPMWRHEIEIEPPIEVAGLMAWSPLTPAGADIVYSGNLPQLRGYEPLQPQTFTEAPWGETSGVFDVIVTASPYASIPNGSIGKIVRRLQSGDVCVSFEQNPGHVRYAPFSRFYVEPAILVPGDHCELLTDVFTGFGLERGANVIIKEIDERYGDQGKYVSIAPNGVRFVFTREALKFRKREIRIVPPLKPAVDTVGTTSGGKISTKDGSMKIDIDEGTISLHGDYSGMAYGLTAPRPTQYWRNKDKETRLRAYTAETEAKEAKAFVVRQDRAIAGLTGQIDTCLGAIHAADEVIAKMQADSLGQISQIAELTSKNEKLANDLESSERYRVSYMQRLQASNRMCEELQARVKGLEHTVTVRQALSGIDSKYERHLLKENERLREALHKSSIKVDNVEHTAKRIRLGAVIALSVSAYFLIAAWWH